MQVYNVKEGKHHKPLLSQKYGVNHAMFGHATGCIIHSSTKLNSIFYLSSLILEMLIRNQIPSVTYPPTTTPTSATSKATKTPSRVSPSTQAKTTSSPAAKTTRYGSGTPLPRTIAASFSSTELTSQPGTPPATSSP